MSSYSLSTNQYCHDVENELCNDCGWKCSCLECSHGSQANQHACYCYCRFWIVICGMVLLGFIMVFTSAVAHRKTVLYLLSTGAIVFTGSLFATALVSEYCVWPTFFSIMTVLVFPCFYSCCWRHYAIRGDLPTIRTTGATRTRSSIQNRETRNKESGAVVMILPDGDIKIGVQETEMANLGDHSNLDAENETGSLAGTSRRTH